ncbi:hypothetical protein ACWDR2_30780 [Streptomyces sp. NPDC003631]|uniref:Uncharacterized protein n=1 Tax=Streptomyces lannensis TaxID=766498 RepID=A0ABP7KYJ8_9ACTN
MPRPSPIKQGVSGGWRTDAPCCFGLNNELSGKTGYLLATDYTALSQVGQLQLGTATGTERVFVTDTHEKGTGRLLNGAVDDLTRGAVQNLNYGYDRGGNVTPISDASNIGAGVHGAA